LRAIFDIDDAGPGGRVYVRCWQLDSPTQIFDDKRVHRVAHALAVAAGAPLCTYHMRDELRSIHLIPRLARWSSAFRKRFPDLPIHPLWEPPDRDGSPPGPHYGFPGGGPCPKEKQWPDHP
jgi:hypothetical protein